MRWPVLHIKAAVLESHGGRVGTVATKALSQGEIYIEVPESSCLGVETARRELGDAAKGLDDFQALLFLLIKHALALASDRVGDLARAPKGHFGPYLALLPGIDSVLRTAIGKLSTTNTEADVQLPPPLFWASTVDEAVVMAADRLVGSALDEAVPAYVASTRRSYEAAIRHIDRTALATIVGDSQVEVSLSWPVFRWAAQTLDSRAIWWGGQRHLVPMLDLVNAADSSETPPGGAIHRTVQTTRHGEPMAATPAAWKFDSGKQVLEDYGQPNHVLFLYHGFGLFPNIHDCALLDLRIDNVPILADLITPGASAFDTVKKRLIGFGFRGFDYTVCLKPGSPNLARTDQFVAVKRGLPHTPPNVSSDTTLALLEEIDDKLKKYDVARTITGLSRKFIEGELSIFKAIRIELADIASGGTFLSLRR